MLRISNYGNYLKIVPKMHYNMPLLHRTLTSYDVLHQFLDCFMKSKDHKIIGSSLVVRVCDSPLTPLTVENTVKDQNVLAQKSSFLFHRKTMFPKIDGGKNMSVVGRSGYKRNFLVVLQNWSFANCYKNGACQLAWNRLKGPYANKSSRLYATHFSDGDEPLKDFIEIEMKNVLENSPQEVHPFIVHFLTCATLLETVHLQKATRFCTDRPIIVLSSSDGEINARCCVPEKFVTGKFSAYLWLATVANAFETELICASPSELNNDEVCHIKPKTLTSITFDEKLEAAMQQANDFARINM